MSQQVSAEPAEPSEVSPAHEGRAQDGGAQDGRAQDGRAQVSSYARGSAANMTRSLLVVLAFMLVLFFAVARPNVVSRPSVDVVPLSMQVARETAWPIEVGVDLPKGWSASNVRYLRSTGGLMMWHVGYQTPDGRYAAIQQTQGGTGEWITAQTNRAPRIGSVTVGERTWQQYERDIKVQNSLVEESSTPDGLTTILTGDADFTELQVLAAHLGRVQLPSG